MPGGQISASRLELSMKLPASRRTELLLQVKSDTEGLFLFWDTGELPVQKLKQLETCDLD
jgi:hypothetical protein